MFGVERDAQVKWDLDQFMDKSPVHQRDEKKNSRPAIEDASSKWDDNHHNKHKGCDEHLLEYFMNTQVDVEETKPLK